MRTEDPKRVVMSMQIDGDVEDRRRFRYWIQYLTMWSKGAVYAREFSGDWFFGWKLI